MGVISSGIGKKLSALGVVMLLLFVSFMGGMQYGLRANERQAAAVQESQQAKYSLLARRILVEQPNDVEINFRPLQTQIEEYIQTNGLTDNISFNFEYLPTGSSIGVAEDTKQVGASLLKLPLAIAVYKASEQGKVNLDEKVTIKQEWLNSSYGTLYKKGAGHQITIRDAVKEALMHSDNTAALLLFDVVTKAQGTNTPNLLGFIDANYGETPSHEVLIDSRSYSAILKCLYFACHLNKDNSQAVLQSLSQSSAKDRLVRYLPAEVPVAHKIGVFSQQTQSDCGVFYVPKRNYVLCIMIDGASDPASKQIGELSDIVYNYIVSNNK